METISPSESAKNIKEESIKRSYKAGYTDSDGQPMISRKLKAAGKGDVPRYVNKEIYDRNYEIAFGHK